MRLSAVRRELARRPEVMQAERDLEDAPPRRPDDDG